MRSTWLCASDSLAPSSRRLLARTRLVVGLREAVPARGGTDPNISSQMLCFRFEVGQSSCCPFFRDKLASMLERISIELTNRCGKGCGFCYNKSHAAGATTWTVDEVATFVSDCSRNGARAVSF